MDVKEFDSVDDFLAHYGILGMKWGVRRQRGSDGTVGGSGERGTSRKLSSKIDNVTRKISGPTGKEPVRIKAEPGKRVKAQGGRNTPASEDAKRAAAMRQIARSSTVDALSNSQLESLLKRMNLERQYAQMNPPTGAKAFIKKFLRQNGKELVPVGYELALTKNPNMAKNAKARAAWQIVALASGSKLPKPQEKKEKTNK